ncbi:MAG: argininosuccinate lyase [Clostridiales bacterium]|jgi:argininosuccinate lyase|nr:argininosuccinate lyase [Clostridiales bacterium]
MKNKPDTLWKGVSSKAAAQSVDDFQSSVPVDGRMLLEDIAGSTAHVFMLGQTGIIPLEEAECLIAGLDAVFNDVKTGRLTIDPRAEDVHTFVETTLIKRLGDIGKKVHTARSRNDQVALDTRLYLRKKTEEIQREILKLLEVLTGLAEAYAESVMPGLTHLQAAQPVTFGHHMLAYCAMLIRDFDRLRDCAKRINVSPLGSCALAGTTHPIDRRMTAKELGMDGACFNSLDGVSDRDFCVEFAACLAILMMHLSRLSEEIVLWCSQNFGYITLDDAYSTGSSIMPQKKNPDVAELVRGKTGRCYGNLVTILTVMKALPLAYNKDMQEDKECVFDSADTALACLPVFGEMLATMRVNEAVMRAAANKGFLCATDCADYLAKKGVPFRDAYKVTGEIVAHCMKDGLTLETLPLGTYKTFHKAFEADIYRAVDVGEAAAKRKSYGAPGAVREQLDIVKAFIKSNGADVV